MDAEADLSLLGAVVNYRNWCGGALAQLCKKMHPIKRNKFFVLNCSEVESSFCQARLW